MSDDLTFNLELYYLLHIATANLRKNSEYNLRLITSAQNYERLFKSRIIVLLSPSDDICLYPSQSIHSQYQSDARGIISTIPSEQYIIIPMCKLMFSIFSLHSCKSFLFAVCILCDYLNSCHWVLKFVWNDAVVDSLLFGCDQSVNNFLWHVQSFFLTILLQWK